MCHWTCTEFVREQLTREDVLGKRVLEVGARDVNGTVRPVIDALSPASYIGVDIARGPGVDEVCDVTDLVSRYGEESFDLVVSTELVEHVRDWRNAFHNMKRVLRSGGVLLVTTRSPGFKVHGYPFDFWRYTPQDMRLILGDFEDLSVVEDRVAPGVFVRGTKPHGWQPPQLDDLPLYSVVTRSRCHDVSDVQVALFKLLYIAHQAYRRVLPERLRARLKATVVRGTWGADPPSFVADLPANDAPYRLAQDVEFGEGVVVYSFTNLYGCRIGEKTRVGPFVEIQRGAVIGANCKIQSHTFICDGVQIEDEVFVGHGVLFINDKYPRAATAAGALQTSDDWELLPTIVERGASLGSGALIMGGVRIGEGAIVGAGAVVTKDVEPGAVVAGNPARLLPRRATSS